MDKYNFFGNDYDLTKSLPVVNGKRLSVKKDIRRCIMDFIRLSGAQFFPFEGVPAILRNFDFVSRSSLVTYLRRLLDQYSSGLISRSSYVDSYGFTNSPCSGRVYHVTVYYKNPVSRVFHRLMSIQEIAPYITNLYDSANTPIKIVVS